MQENGIIPEDPQPSPATNSNTNASRSAAKSKEAARYKQSQDARSAMSEADRKKADMIAHKMNLIE